MNQVWSGESRRCDEPAGLVGAGGVDQQRQLVEAGLGVLVGGPGSVTPTSTIRSRWLRSISVAPSASCTGCSCARGARFLVVVDGCVDVWRRRRRR